MHTGLSRLTLSFDENYAALTYLFTGWVWDLRGILGSDGIEGRVTIGRRGSTTQAISLGCR
jgi:hypothetical protein